MTYPAVCTRLTAKRRPCRATVVQWCGITVLPHPQACFQHLTHEERAVIDQIRADEKAAWLRYVNQDPACWAWPSDRVPEPAADVVESAIADVLPVPPLGPETDAHMALLAWHGGRCALCGRVQELVEDHDHRTGLVRGYLCQGCNAREGANRGGVPLFDRYRNCPPAAILGLRVRYMHPVTGEYAQPQAEPNDADAWTDAASEGIGL